MKNLLLGLIVFFAGTAFADDYVDQINRLPAIYGAQIEIDYGPQDAAVEPSAFVNFKFKSCARFTFDVAVESIENILLVAVEQNPLQRECFGPRIEREYHLQINSMDDLNINSGHALNNL